MQSVHINDTPLNVGSYSLVHYDVYRKMRNNRFCSHKLKFGNVGEAWLKLLASSENAFSLHVYSDGLTLIGGTQ